MPHKKKTALGIIVTFILIAWIWVFIDTLIKNTKTKNAQNTKNAEAISGFSPVNLVLWITIDQLRADIFENIHTRFSLKGFGYLIENGIWYKNAEFLHSTTLTSVGHAALFTGGNVSRHGISGNDWIDSITGDRVYCVGDNRHNILHQKKIPYKGVSPLNLTSSTVGDELIKGTNRNSCVFSVSIKDRGAIIPAGHLGKAFWYSTKSGQFITSTYYYPEYPVWVNQWNKKKEADRYKNHRWDLLYDKSSYIFKDSDSRLQEKGYKKLGTTFPHDLSNENLEDYYSSLQYTPIGDELTLNFVLELMKMEKLGQHDQPDMLAVSFSGLDYVGHAFGPHSLEYEDHILRLDIILETLFSHVDKTIGMNNTLIILASDHGVDLIPEYHQSINVPAGRLNPEEFILTANTALKKKYGIEEDLIQTFWNPYVYLELDTIKKLGLNISGIEKAAANELINFPGIAMAVTRTELQEGHIPPSPVMEKIRAAFHPERSGNVFIVQEKHWYLYHDPDTYAAMHGSPYEYDTHVPVLLAGKGLKPQIVNRAVHPENIAPTIAFYLQINPPSGSIGSPLKEIVESLNNDINRDY